MEADVRIQIIMSLTQLTTKELSRIQKLVEQKESLAQRIEEINRDLEAMEAGSSQSESPSVPSNGRAAGAARGRKAAAPQKTAGKAGRGQLKDRISAELKAAGKPGIKVKDLAARLGTNYGNVTAFFVSTAKKIDQIKKVGPARFAWVGA